MTQVVPPGRGKGKGEGAFQLGLGRPLPRPFQKSPQLKVRRRMALWKDREPRTGNPKGGKVR